MRFGSCFLIPLCSLILTGFLLAACGESAPAPATQPDSLPALPPPPADYAARVPVVPEATDVVSGGPDHLRREAVLTAPAAAA